MMIKKILPTFFFCICITFIFAETKNPFRTSSYKLSVDPNNKIHSSKRPANLELHCPTNAQVPPCFSATELDSMFSAWKSTASYSGGCNAFLTYEQGPPPSSCGGSSAVIFTAISECDSSLQCTAIFKVDSASPLQLICPPSVVETSCQAQSSILQKFQDWLIGVEVYGGCEPLLESSFTHYPSACGDSVWVEFKVSSNCDTIHRCHALFSVDYPTSPILHCPPYQLEDTGQTQASIDSLYLVWKSGFTFSGGCNPIAMLDSIPAPKSIGGTNYINFSVSSDCAPTIVCKDTFEVKSINPVSLFCPPNRKENSCQTPEEIQSKFEAWKNLVHFTGGCNPVLTIDSDINPESCGSLTLVTFTILSDCEYPSSCTSLFEVIRPEPVQLNCPTDFTFPSCQTPESIDSAFLIWKNSATYAGGCHAQFSRDAGTFPDPCGGTTSLTFRLSSDCDTVLTCSASFTVSNPSPVILSCPKDVVELSCQSQTLINSKFEDWKKTVTFQGGCHAVLTEDLPAPPNACGGITTLQFTVHSDCEAPVSCSATFQVKVSSPVVLTCPDAVSVIACSLQDSVDLKFNDWVNAASFSGGCNSILIHNTANIPSACGGAVSLSFTVTSDCESPKSCNSTFTVQSPAPVMLNCPNDVVETSCQSQAAITSKFLNWKTSAVFSGGCNPVLTNNGIISPTACGSVTMITFKVRSECESEKSCTATFKVDTARAVELQCPLNQTEAACQTQASVDARFANWKNTAFFTGACNGVLTHSAGPAPDHCGGAVSVTFTVTSDCESMKSCTASFTVTDAPDLILTCPVPVMEVACQTQASIDAKFAIWKNTAFFTGACGGILSNTGGLAPDKCGGTTTVSFTVLSDCENPVTCSSTFAVASAPKVALTCPEPVTEAACQTQAAINAKFTAWKATASFIGACNAVLTHSTGQAPNACGGASDISFTVTSDCEAPVTCNASFKVSNAPAVVLTCPSSVTESACSSQEEINSKFAAWKNTASFTGGCNGVLSNNGASAPGKCGGTATLIFSANTDCDAPKTCSASFTVMPPPPVSLTCPDSIQVQKNDNPSDLIEKFNLWKSKAVVTGGCNSKLTISSDTLPVSEGTVQVLFSVQSDCDTLHQCSSQFVVLRGTAVEDQNQYDFELFPNPANDFIILKNKFNVFGSVNLQIIDLNGCILFDLKNIRFQDEWRMKTENLPSGHYLLKMSNKQGVRNYRFQIVR